MPRYFYDHSKSLQRYCFFMEYARAINDFQLTINNFNMQSSLYGPSNPPNPPNLSYLSY